MSVSTGLGASCSDQNGHHDVNCFTAIRNPNMLVPWYLMTSYVYYHLDDNLISDAMYDRICRELVEHWDQITHRHRELIDYEALSAGTGCTLNYSVWPMIIIESAEKLLREMYS